MTTESYIDLEMARRGCVLPVYIGINLARAADRSWERDRSETEAEFIRRVRREARAEGFAVVVITGHLNVEEKD